MGNAEIWGFLSDVARVVLASVIVAIGVGMINIGNRTRKLATQQDQIEQRCRSHGMPYSDIPERVARLEETCLARTRVGERRTQEMRQSYSSLLKRIDTLDAKMHKHVDRLEEKLLTEIRRVNGKVEGAK